MGGWSIRGSPTGQVDIVDGKVTFARGQLRYASDRTTLDGVSTVSLPAEPIARKVLDPGAHLSGPEGSVGALMTEQTAARLGLQTVVVEARVIDPRGAITEDAAGRLGYAVADLGLGNFYVERGFEAYDAIVATIVLGIVGLIILVATLVSTALSTAETQPLMGTFAAVGATRRTRRNLAAAQAASLGILGALLGVLVGFVPGIAFARTLSAAASIGLEEPLSPVGPIVVIPWLPLLIAVLGVPLLAGALAWLSIRRRPTVTRRLT